MKEMAKDVLDSGNNVEDPKNSNFTTSRSLTPNQPALISRSLAKDETNDVTKLKSKKSEKRSSGDNLVTSLSTIVKLKHKIDTNSSKKLTFQNGQLPKFKKKCVQELPVRHHIRKPAVDERNVDLNQKCKQLLSSMSIRDARQKGVPHPMCYFDWKNKNVVRRRSLFVPIHAGNDKAWLKNLTAKISKSMRQNGCDMFQEPQFLCSREENEFTEVEPRFSFVKRPPYATFTVKYDEDGRKIAMPKDCDLPDYDGIFTASVYREKAKDLDNMFIKMSSRAAIDDFMVYAFNVRHLYMFCPGCDFGDISNSKRDMYFRQSVELPLYRVPSRLLQELLRLHLRRGSEPDKYVPWLFNGDPRFDDMSAYDGDNEHAQHDAESALAAASISTDVRAGTGCFYVNEQSMYSESSFQDNPPVHESSYRNAYIAHVPQRGNTNDHEYLPAAAQHHSEISFNDDSHHRWSHSCPQPLENCQAPVLAITGSSSTSTYSFLPPSLPSSDSSPPYDISANAVATTPTSLLSNEFCLTTPTAPPSYTNQYHREMKLNSGLLPNQYRGSLPTELNQYEDLRTASNQYREFLPTTSNQYREPPPTVSNHYREYPSYDNNATPSLMRQLNTPKIYRNNTHAYHQAINNQATPTYSGYLPSCSSQAPPTRVGNGYWTQMMALPNDHYQNQVPPPRSSTSCTPLAVPHQ